MAGEFSPKAQGGTPFAPPILRFPTVNNAHMFDLLISDYTINTLLYHFHRADVFTFRIGPEVPHIGDLLNITCRGDDFDFDLSAEVTDAKLKVEIVCFFKNFSNDISRQNNRKKRQGPTESFRNFGACFGDIAPEIREKNHGKQVYIMVKTTRAPSIQFKAINKGSVIIDLMVDGVIYLNDNNVKVGHIRVYAVFEISGQLIGNRIISKAQIIQLKLTDVGHTFGLPADTFANLADLARGSITRVLNDKLSQGITIDTPKLGLPLDLHNVRLKVVEHALLMSTDIKVRAQSLFLLSSYRSI
ncbi:unnamed protein product [Thelazia callipaeda]|uniref:BPI2 domain-containing protein n=1 Tax=Thelazia callipaeda TaxID=103827 RepID=A0A0N5D2D2_THECL|nr:unnamed protein product [Thelazia callipaeda]